MIPEEQIGKWENERDKAEIELQKRLRAVLGGKPWFFTPRQLDRVLVKVIGTIKKELIGASP